MPRAVKLFGGPGKSGQGEAAAPVRGGSRDTGVRAFREGRDYGAYRFFGAHLTSRGGVPGVRFRVWAPGAKAVSVTGDFNDWSRDAHPCAKLSGGVWEKFVPGLKTFDAYKYAVLTRGGVWLDKADPFAFHAATPPQQSSKVYDLSGCKWNDAHWIRDRENSAPGGRPMNIYGLHMGSWRRNGEGGYLSYAETAELLIPYVKEMGYTHIGLTPLTEYPPDDSRDCGVSGYFAATSRFGTPHHLMALVDRCHQAGIGVFMDWNPAYFSDASHGLTEFDGTCCYERSRTADGGGKPVFDHRKNEVRSFLISSALFWLEHFHLDGLIVNDLTPVLFTESGRESPEGLAFLRELNSAASEMLPGVTMIAGESSGWPVTLPANAGGAGFSMKCGTDWADDTLAYMRLPYDRRQYVHCRLTLAAGRGFPEPMVLPVTHHHVAAPGVSLAGGMPGGDDDKLAGVRAFLGYMMAHPGRKLLFMGSEFGQMRGWDFRYSLDWHLLDDPRHRQLQHYVRTLNYFYLDNSALWGAGCGRDGFVWLCGDDFQGGTLSFSRTAPDGGQLIALFNFSPVNRLGYRVGLPSPGTYTEVLNSDAAEFGGWGNVNANDMRTEPFAWQGRPQSLQLTLPPFGAVFIKNRDSQL